MQVSRAMSMKTSGPRYHRTHQIFLVMLKSKAKHHLWSPQSSKLLFETFVCWEIGCTFRYISQIVVMPSPVYTQCLRLCSPCLQCCSVAAGGCCCVFWGAVCRQQAAVKKRSGWEHKVSYFGVLPHTATPKIYTMGHFLLLSLIRGKLFTATNTELQIKVLYVDVKSSIILKKSNCYCDQNTSIVSPRRNNYKN